MTVEQLIAYVRPFYPTWDEELCRKLQRDLDLTSRLPVRSFSRGMRMKAALLVSLAYRPELVVLDEPFSGLDPLARDELIRALLELTGEHNWTTLISSHDIDEVERLADSIAFIDKGRICHHRLRSGSGGEVPASAAGHFRDARASIARTRRQSRRRYETRSAPRPMGHAPLPDSAAVVAAAGRGASAAARGRMAGDGGRHGGAHRRSASPAICSRSRKCLFSVVFDHARRPGTPARRHNARSG